jgi:hypothetical protein
MRLPTVLLAAALLGLGGCKDEPPHAVVGSWRDTRWDDSTDLFQREYTFHPDGVLAIKMRRPAAADTTFRLTYAFSRDSFLTLSDPGSSEQFVARILGDTLVLRTPEMTSTFVRVRG